jgi:hypothetical protein
LFWRRANLIGPSLKKKKTMEIFKHSKNEVACASKGKETSKQNGFTD